jgi:hypothetical protein
MDQNPLPYPPQMGNGGSPPAHLPSSSLSDPLAWLQYKLSQPPPRAPDWVFDVYQKFNPLRDEEWLQRAFREDEQAAGILPPDPPGGPILLGARARAERAYLDWRWTVDALWEDERRCRQLLDEQAARARQEAAIACSLQGAAAIARARQEAAATACARHADGCRRQQLLVVQAARARHADERRQQQLLVEQAARARQEDERRRQQLLTEQAARARQEDERRLQQLLDEQAARRQQLLHEQAARARQEAAAARARHEVLTAELECLMAEICCDMAFQAEMMSAFISLLLSARVITSMEAAAKALPAKESESANAADDRRHETLAAMTLAAQESKLAKAADNRRGHDVAAHAEALAAQALAEALAEESRLQEVAARAAALTAQALAEAAVKPDTPALLSPSPRPTSLYLGAVLNTNEGGHSSSTSTSPTVAAPTLPSVVDGKPLRVRHRAQPRHRTGCRNCPCVPNPSNKDTPSHLSSTLGDFPTPTQMKLARATSPCCSEVLSTTPYLTTPHTPSLFPSNLVGFTVSTAGGNAHPFQTGGPTPPLRKRT